MRGPGSTVVALVLLVAPACGVPSGAAPDQGARPRPTAATPAATPAEPPFVAPATTAPVAVFDSAITGIDAATAERMSESWRPGCPVPLADLRLVTLSHWDFDGAEATGELVVHRDVADDVVHVFAELFDARFPVMRMELVDVYRADDDLSTAANNTSAFNCRAVTGGTRWSEHSYGTAIDVNPVQNPYVSHGRVVDPAAEPYLDRSLRAPGMLFAGDVAVSAFEQIGWEWGGRWTEPVDFQHFSATGR